MNIYYKYYEYMIVLSNCVLLLSVYQRKLWKQNNLLTQKHIFYIAERNDFEWLSRFPR